MDEDEAKLRKDLERLKHHYSLEYEMIRAINAFEHAALRPLFLLNGGALVVYLGLFGALRRADRSEQVIDWATGRLAVSVWAVGLVCATLATFFAAWSQFAFRKQRGREVDREEIRLAISNKKESEIADKIKSADKVANRARVVALVLGFASIALFLRGLWLAFDSILK